MPPYGRWSLPPNEYGTREGMASLSFNFFGEGAFHEEVYTPERGYFAQGIEEPQTWVFRRMYGDAVIAARLLQAQAEADAAKVGAMGLSQGGGMALWLGAWCPVVSAVCADLPFLSDVGRTLTANVVRYPLREVREVMDAMPLGEPRVMNTLSYFDTGFVAEQCAIPTQVSLGLRDPATRPPTVQRIFERLPGEKRLIEYAGGHDWDPQMVPEQPRVAPAVVRRVRLSPFPSGGSARPLGSPDGVTSRSLVQAPHPPFGHLPLKGKDLTLEILPFRGRCPLKGADGAPRRESRGGAPSPFGDPSPKGKDLPTDPTRRSCRRPGPGARRGE